MSTPIALGERLHSRSDFRPYLEARALDIAQPDVRCSSIHSWRGLKTVLQVAHCGGISELHRIASLTETYDVALAPHCPLGPIALAACMQVDIAAPNCASLMLGGRGQFLTSFSRLCLLVCIQELSLQVRRRV